MDEAGSETSPSAEQFPPETPPAPQQKPRRRLNPWLAGAAALLLVTGGAGLAYATAGGWRSPAPVLDQYFDAAREKNRAALKATLVPRAQEQLARVDLDRILEGLPNYERPVVTYRIVYPEGVQRYFTRHATVVFMYDSDRSRNIHQAYQPIHLQLNRGQWGIVPIGPLASAAATHALEIQKARQVTGERPTMDRAGIQKIRATTQKHAGALKALLATALAYDEEFTAQKLQQGALDNAGVIESRLTRFARLNATEDLFIQASARREGGDLQGAMALLKQVTQSTAATAEQKARAREELSNVGTSRLSELLSEANNLYNRAEYQQAISKLQMVLDSEDATDDQRAQAQYLASFAYRDYTDAPNNMQRAIGAARVSTSLAGGNATYWCHLGDLLRQYDVNEEANTAFQKGIEAAWDPETKANCYVWQGVNYRAQGEYEIARYVWETALSLDPSNDDARRFLESYSFNW